MDWWLVLIVLMIGAGLGILAAMAYFVWSFRDFMG